MAHVSSFQTLADPTRLRIIEFLRDGEQAVNDIVNRMKIDQPGVSRHLRILNEAGFVQMRPDGQKRLYSLRAEPFQEFDEWISRYRQVWEKRLDRFGEALKQNQKSRKSKEKSK